MGFCVVVSMKSIQWLKDGSYIAIVACFSSPALHSISAVAEARTFLLVVLEGLSLLRKKWQSSGKQVAWLNNTPNAAATKHALM